MPPTEDLSDDFVVEQLKKDARESYLKYSSIGIDAFRPKGRASPALKPNTRFLKAIIKETDIHNASLRKAEVNRTLSDKERGDSRLGESSHRRHGRRRSKSRSRSSERGSSRGSGRDHRRGHSRRHVDGGSPSSLGKRDDKRRERSGDASHSTRHRRSRSRSPRGRAKDSYHEERESHADYKSRSHGRRHRDRHRDGHSPASTDDQQDSAWRRSPERRSRRHERSSRRSDKHGKRKQNPKAEISNLPNEKQAKSPGDESDPLEQILGKSTDVTKPIPRGRGANRLRANMDEHFNPSYDPTTDVQANSDEDDDWGQALEALRDRQRWKQLGASRLKEAGFSEKEVSKWEKGGEEREDDIQWKRSGEGREWDRGKVVSAEGHIDTAPEWAKT